VATLKELAEAVGGGVIGDEEVEIRNVAPIEVAGEGDITFVANPKYVSWLSRTRASAVIIADDSHPSEKPLLITRNPYLAFARILTILRVQRPEPLGVLPGAHVAPSATVSETATVHPGSVVAEGCSIGAGTVLHPGVVLYENVKIGEECILHAGVVVREGCRLGNRVILQPNAVIGSDGFGFAPDGPRYFKIPQVGTVDIEDDVEIGSATCVDRATLGVTRIKRGCKIDNLVQVAHNVEIGEDTIVVSQVGISGSARIGRHCTFGGQAGIAGHISIGDNVMIGARGGVANNVKGNQVLSGAPVMPHKEWLKATMSFAKLPEMRKEISRLKRQLEELEMHIHKG
jgi:UDP-3-O-[3-hydroxymyristoyl] glucosamine N-acyltransferase